MILRYGSLSRHPTVFQTMTGLRLGEFAALLGEMQPRYGAARLARLTCRPRQRVIGGGRTGELAVRDQLLLTIVWLRHYPICEVLAYLFRVSDTTVSRTIAGWLPLLEAAGRDMMRRPDPGKKQQHTLTSQVTIDEITGQVVEVADSVPGPTADIKVVEQSGVLKRMPPGVGAAGDLAYVGMDTLHPPGDGVTPRRTPRGQDRPPEDGAYNRACARRRVRAEHTSGPLRR